MRAGSKLFGNHRALLSSAAGVPAWVVNGSNPPDIAFDFTNSRAWKKSGGTLSASSQLTCSRASVGYVNDASGNWTSVAANQPRISNNGLLVEEARTNSIRNNSMQGAMVKADGVELLTNGNFASAGTGWTTNISGGNVVIVNGSTTITGNGTDTNNYIAQQISGLTIGRSYVVSMTGTGAAVNCLVGTSAHDNSLLNVSLVPNGAASTNLDRAAFTATATSHWVTIARQSATPVVVNSVSVQDGERVENGSFTSNPINASQNTVQNGWQWTVGGGTSTVTYGANLVNLNGDGTNNANLVSSAIPTVSGVTYTLSVDIGGSSTGLLVGTAAFGSTLLNTTANVGTGKKFQFTATTATSFVTFAHGSGGANNTATIANVSVQSAGQLPTNWGIQANSGLLTNVVALGTESGIDYMDVQVVGTTNSTLYQLRIGEGPSQIAVTYGQTWSQSVFLKQVGGSYTNVSNFILCAFEYTSGTSFLTSDPNTTNMSNPGSSALGSQRFTNNFTVSSATAAFLMPVLQFSVANASAVNLTLRIGWPQLENNPLLNSTVASAVTAASGASGVNGTAIYQVGGGTGTTAATLSVTWAAGVLTINGVNGGGSYTTFPPSPAALTYVSGTATGWTGATVNLTPSTNAAVGFPTSPIRTTAASATRATDVVTMPFTFGSAYSLYAKGATESPTTGIETILEAYAAGTDRTSIRRNGTVNQFIASGGSGFLDTSVAGWPQNTTAKMAGAAASSDQAMSFNGAPIVATASVTLPATPTSITFGSGNNGVSFNWNGFIAEAAIWASQRVPNAQLQSITTIAPSVDLNFAAGAYTGVSGSPSSFLTTSRASTAYVNDSLGNWTSVGSNLPRISNLGLLVEEARTNSIRCNDGTGASGGTPPNNWSQGGASGTTVTYSPGTMNGIAGVYVTVVGTDASGFLTLFPDGNGTTIAASNGQIWSPSVFVALTAGSLPAGFSNLNLQIREKTSGGAAVTTDNGSSITPTSALQRMYYGGTTDTGGYTLAGGGTVAFAQPLLGMNYNTGTAVNFTLFVGGFQFELGASVTSPIRTTAAAATRAADVVTMTTPPTFGSAYSLFAKGTPQTPTSYAANQGFAAISDGTSSNRSLMYRNAATGAATDNTLSGGVGSGQGSPGNTWAQNVTGRFAFAVTTNDFAGVFNGGTPATGASVTMPVSPNAIHLGDSGAGVGQWNGFIAQVSVWPNNRIPNAQLQTVTT